MKIKSNPQGHKRGVGEVWTRGYTDIGWRSSERSSMLHAARVKGHGPVNEHGSWLYCHGCY